MTANQTLLAGRNQRAGNDIDPHLCGFRLWPEVWKLQYEREAVGPRRAWEVARIRFVTWLFECFATPINRTRRKNVSCPNASNRRTGQWEVDVPFQTDPQNGMTSEGYMSRDSTASCFEFAYSHTVAENCRCLVAKR